MFIALLTRGSVTGFVLLAASWSHAQVRDFHLTNGKIINGELSAATDREVVISPVPMKRTTRLLLSELTPADQAHVATWRQARSALGKVPFHLRIAMKKTISTKLENPSIIVGFQVPDGRFFSGRRATKQGETDVYGPFPGEIVNEHWEISLGVTHSGTIPLGPFDIEGEIWHGELMKAWVKKQEITAHLPVIAPNKETTVTLPVLSLARARAKSGSFGGGGSSKKDEIEHVNLRVIINGKVAAELVTNSISRQGGDN